MKQLYIKTDLTNQKWLTYLLAEFSRIQKFDAYFNIVDLKAPLPEGADVIYYAEHVQDGITIVNHSSVQPSEKVIQLSLDLFVIDGFLTKDDRFCFSYDLFWNAFVFLSGLEEYTTFKKGRGTKSHCILHPRSDRSTFTVPIVNVLFGKLEALIKDKYPQLPFGESDKPIIELAHDVDYISKSPAMIIKQSMLNCYDVFRSVTRPKDCWKNFIKTWSFLFNNTSYWCFEYWQDLEKQFDVRSIFYVHAKVKKNIITTFIDPNYDLTENRRLQDKLRELLGEGFHIGLHGSYFSATNGDILEQEKQILENALGQPVVQTRQHWLRFVEDVTPLLHEEYFEKDSTLGWNDRVGFRNGCASAFHPYNHAEQRPYKHLEIPQIIMDFNVYQSLGLENMEFVNRTVQVLERVLKCKSVQASISWHQRASTTDYQWEKTYEHLLRDFICHPDYGIQTFKKEGLGDAIHKREGHTRELPIESPGPKS